MFEITAPKADPDQTLHRQHPFTLPLAYAVIESVRLLKTQKSFRARLEANANHIKAKLRELGFPIENFPDRLLVTKDRQGE